MNFNKAKEFGRWAGEQVEIKKSRKIEEVFNKMMEKNVKLEKLRTSPFTPLDFKEIDRNLYKSAFKSGYKETF